MIVPVDHRRRRVHEPLLRATSSAAVEARGRRAARDRRRHISTIEEHRGARAGVRCSTRARGQPAASTSRCSRETAVEQALQKLARELSSQYKVVYGRPESLIPPEKIECRRRAPGVTMRGTPARGADWEPDVTRVRPCSRRSLAPSLIAPSSASADAARPRPAPRSARRSTSCRSTSRSIDGANHYVTDLEQADFSVFEDGVKQDITFFKRRQQPIALSLLLDSSASMEDKLPIAAGGGGQLRQAAEAERHRAGDRLRQPRRDPPGVHRQPGRARIGHPADGAGGSTSLHNAIYIALKELGRSRRSNEEDVRRQALIVFSDGEDTSSLVSFDEVLDLAKRSETSIYTIALRGTDTQTQGLPRGRVRDAPARAGNRRPRRSSRRRSRT